MFSKYVFPSIFIFMIAALTSWAQDGHYWSENYGNRSMLLSGTVNASVEDLGAVFYNPGRLGLIDNPAFAISARVYEWRTFKIEDQGEEGIKLNKSNFGGAPSLAAGTFKLPFLKNHRFAYSFLTRQRTKMDFFTRVEKEGDLINGLPGNQDIFNGTLNLGTDFREEWIGLTWAPPYTKYFNFGLSTFISTLNKNLRIGQTMHALNEFNQAGYYSVNRKYNYESYGVLWKLGLALTFDKIRFGLTVTTPRLNVYGDGSAEFEDYLVGVDTTGDGNNDDAYIFNTQQNLKVKYRSPWAIGFGTGIPFKNGIIHLSAEWYQQIRDYAIMSIDPFVGQSTGDTFQFVLKERLESVLNFGLGLEWHFSEKLSAYASFATDYSAVPNNLNRLSDLGDRANNSVFKADFFQFGGGISVTTKAVEITFGTTRNGAANTFEHTLNFPDEGQGDTDFPTTANLTFSNWRFILGFSFPFVERFSKKIEGDE